MKTILVTDDDADTNQILCRLLKMAGYRPVSASHGEQALERMSVEHPDLVILDMMMPGIDGVQVLQRIRSEPRFASTPVIAYSALSDPTFQQHVRASSPW